MEYDWVSVKDRNPDLEGYYYCLRNFKMELI